MVFSLFFSLDHMGDSYDKDTDVFSFLFFMFELFSKRLSLFLTCQVVSHLIMFFSIHLLVFFSRSPIYSFRLENKARRLIR
jgi:hypothetical protein